MFKEKKTAVVTGGASGIGLAISQFLARDGADVAIWDMNIDAAQKAAEDIVASGGSAMACSVDVSSRPSVEAATQAVREKFGPIHILVNNAGVSGFCSFDSITDEAWDQMMNVNLKGVYFCSQTVLGDMVDAGWGRIINVSSSSAQAGAQGMVHYAASKGGVISFTKALALELGPKGITVNNVPPGFIDTPMLRQSELVAKFPGGVEGYAKQVPVRRAGRPEDIAAACSFLASEEAGYITGHTLGVNGGRYMA